MSIIGQPIMAGGGGVTANIEVTGDVASTDTCNATFGSKQKNGAWTEAQNPSYHLPSSLTGYTELEYIQSSGTQYIDTEYIYSNSKSVSYFLDYQEISPSSNFSFFGARNKNNGGFSGIPFQRYIFVASNDEPSTAEVFGTITRTSSPATMLVEFDVTRSKGHFKQTVNGVTTDDVETTLMSPSMNTSIALFGDKNALTSSVVQLGSLKVYEFKITEDGDVVRDLIPCKRDSDNAIGLYDIANNHFYEKMGTGVFIAGSEVPKYIYYWNIKGIKDYGTWTVDWSDESETHTYTEDVLIDVITTYEVEIEV